MSQRTTPNVREQIRTALATHPVREVARVLGLSRPTVTALALPDSVSRVHPGSIALAEKNAAALSTLTALKSESRA